LSQFYNEPSDEFRGVYSRYLPIIENFIKFWDETMVVDEFETDFEVDELSMLFKVWCSSTNTDCAVERQHDYRSGCVLLSVG
jgi:hypothetical protein